ncbi:MAG: hypothetical protein RLY70_3095, partial [Planctomycetota bacterium]
MRNGECGGLSVGEVTLMAVETA